MDGKIVSINEEERFTRNKHATNVFNGQSHGDFPANAIKECLRVGGIGPKDLDVIACGWNPNTELQKRRDRADFLKLSTDRMLAGFSSLEIDARVSYYNHHLCHVASSFFCSGFSFSNLLSLDGSGDDCSGWLGFSEGTFSNYHDITTHQVNPLSFNEVIPVDYSWGRIWEDVTEFLGFIRHSGEGKTMGLASYGKYNLEALPGLFMPDGSPNLFEYNMFFEKKGWSIQSGKMVDPLSQEGKDTAYMLQHHYNNYLTKKAIEMVADNGCSNFCLAGGVALNCTGNGHLASLDFVDEVFVQPAAADNGTALGAAILGCKEHGGNFENNFDHAYWGSEFSQDDINKELDEQNLNYTHYNNPSERVADLLAQDKVVCNFQGRAEIGPRALGNRSILANPCSKGMLDKVNKIKGREPWRPLAPSILEEDYFDVVESKIHSPYMLMACQVKESYKDKIPAVVHVDGSCRPQTVYKKTNPIFHDIILEFKKRTGIPLVLNTSFNLSYEPIVNSPYDAIRTFMESDADSLCVGNFIVEK
jgi:carbamoyltransferase